MRGRTKPVAAALSLLAVAVAGSTPARADTSDCGHVSVATVAVEKPVGNGEPAAIFTATFVKDGTLFERGVVFTWAFVLPDGEDKVVRGSATIGRKRLTVEVELGRTDVPPAPGDMDFAGVMDRTVVTACGFY